MPKAPVSYMDFLTLVHGDPDPEASNAIKLVANRLRDMLVDGIYIMPAFRSINKLAPRCFLWVALNSEVGPELSPNFQDTTIWDKTNANRRIGSNHCEAVSKELRIDILRLPTRNSEEPYLFPRNGLMEPDALNSGEKTSKQYIDAEGFVRKERNNLALCFGLE